MCGYDYEPIRVQDSRNVRARREHECFACHETIREGDKYVRTGQLMDGRWSTYNHCLRCWEMLELLWQLTEDTVEWALDCGEVWEEPSLEVAALAFKTHDEVQALPGARPR